MKFNNLLLTVSIILCLLSFGFLGYRYLISAPRVNQWDTQLDAKGLWLLPGNAHLSGVQVTNSLQGTILSATYTDESMNQLKMVIKNEQGHEDVITLPRLALQTGMYRANYLDDAHTGFTLVPTTRDEANSLITQSGQEVMLDISRFVSATSQFDFISKVVFL
jgi:hypothetical protein